MPFAFGKLCVKDFEEIRIFLMKSSFVYIADWTQWVEVIRGDLGGPHAR